MLLNEPPIFNEKIVVARIISIDWIIGIVVKAWRAKEIELLSSSIKTMEVLKLIIHAICVIVVQVFIMIEYLLIKLEKLSLLL